MRSIAILLFVAGILHFFLQVPLVIAAGGAFVLWVIWKLKWIILGILGLEMLFGGGDGSDA
ncbi:hypothetical protein [Magnetospirillum sp. 15-1]|uniref:hypothetical protein n=1 Tax=Magnetospirillum sp. 15-1 TaxID=1979370 RepID=UPI000BBBA6DB|nr:hypothetical protein [Magnetospirillum sp. 15-1]